MKHADDNLTKKDKKSVTLIESEEKVKNLKTKSSDFKIISSLKKVPSIYIGENDNFVNVPHVIAMVGLPGTGKTYIVNKLTRYLNWTGIKTQMFNLNDYRRADETIAFKDFYKEEEKYATHRAELNLRILDDMCDWLENEGEVAIYDTTNATRERREIIYDFIKIKKGYKLFFVESVCDDEEIINENIQNVKVGNPDYISKNAEEAMADYRQLIEYFKSIYETLDKYVDVNYSFMKIINGGKKVIVYQHEGHIQSKIIYFLMNIHISKRTIYLSRHGESIHNTKGILGGDPDLSPQGKLYARALGEYIDEQKIEGLKVWTSWFKRTIHTAKYVAAPQERLKSLNEIDAGLRDEMTYAEIKEKYPDEFLARDLNKFIYRYPKGESYEDVVARLEPIIMELERQDNVLVVTHQAIVRCLLAYFLDKTHDELPYLRVPLHTIIKLTPVAYGCRVEFIKMPIVAVDTHRAKPKVPGYLEMKFQRFSLIEETPVLKTRIMQKFGENKSDEQRTFDKGTQTKKNAVIKMEDLITVNTDIFWNGMQEFTEEGVSCATIKGKATCSKKCSANKE